ncbi:MAG: Gfo/Idh/MocA family oxidoreductase [Planctomycetota bacterium]
MKKWNIAIVGAGVIADFHASAIKNLKNADLIGFADSLPEKAKMLAEKFSCKAYQSPEHLFEDDSVDVVTIATPSGAHLEPTIAAAKAGKHIICEKPLEITLSRIDAMIEAHEKAGTFLGCIFQNRFSDAIAPLRQAVTSGRFGTITCAAVYVPWWRSDDYYKDSWHGTWKLDGGGALMNQSIHMVDMLCDLMGEVTEVKAFADHLGHDIEAEDTAVAIVRFANRALGIIYGTTASSPGQFKRFEITGTKGTVFYLEDGFTVWSFAEETVEDEKIRTSFAPKSKLGGKADHTKIEFENHRRNFAAFLESLERGEKPLLDGHEGRKAVKLVLDIYKAAGILPRAKS